MIFDAYRALLHVVDELLCVGWLLAEVAGRQSGGGLALGHRARQRAGEHRLGDAGDGHAEVERGLHRPAAGALLLGLVEDDVDQRLAGLGVGLTQHLRGDLDEEAVQVALVPFGEDVGDLGCGLAEAVAQQLVGLADQLHVGVLDAVVHHLDEVPGAVGADVGAARHAVDVRGDLLQQRAQRLVRLGGTARHDRRAVQCALLAAGDAGADEVQAAFADRLFAADGVGVERVAAVDDDVAVFHRVGELVDDGVGRVTRLDHDDHPPRLLQRVQEFFDGLRRTNLPSSPCSLSSASVLAIERLCSATV